MYGLIKAGLAFNVVIDIATQAVPWTLDPGP